MQLRSPGRVFGLTVALIGFAPVAYCGTPDEVVYLDALKAERPAWLRLSEYETVATVPGNAELFRFTS